MADTQEFPFEQFKELFMTFLKNNFRDSGPVVGAISTTTSERELNTTLKLYSEELFLALDGDFPNCDDKEYELEELRDEIQDLERYKEELEVELGELKGMFGTTLEDDFKRMAIKTYYDDYRSWELEELLKNGRKFINQ